MHLFPFTGKEIGRRVVWRPHAYKWQRPDVSKPCLSDSTALCFVLLLFLVVITLKCQIFASKTTPPQCLLVAKECELAHDTCHILDLIVLSWCHLTCPSSSWISCKLGVRSKGSLDAGSIKLVAQILAALVHRILHSMGRLEAKVDPRFRT